MANLYLTITLTSTVDATTDGTGFISQMTFNDLRRLDAAYWFTTDGMSYPLRGKGITIPTFQEVLDEFIHVEHLVFLIDFKQKEAISPVLEIIEERGIEDRVILGAVPPSINRELIQLRPSNIPVIVDAKTMIITILLDKIRLSWMYHIKHDIVGFIVDGRTNRLITNRLILQLLRRGHWVAVFGAFLDDEHYQRHFINLGVQLIVTDRPDILRKTIEDYHSERANR